MLSGLAAAKARPEPEIGECRMGQRTTNPENFSGFSLALVNIEE